MFKINIGTKTGKTVKLEIEAPALEGKELGQTIKGEEISPDLTGYEFEIKGASDKAGFTALEKVQGTALKKELLSYEKAMHKRPKHEGKTKRSDKTPKGLRLRKTVRGKVISPAIVQINLKLIKEGNKKLQEIYPDQFPQPETPPEQSAPTGIPAETPKEEESTKKDSKEKKE
jgi:small subunit ribosomal protein S6e